MRVRSTARLTSKTAVVPNLTDMGTSSIQMGCTFRLLSFDTVSIATEVNTLYVLIGGWGSCHQQGGTDVRYPMLMVTW